jgi:tetratricopeptide (TPR) repeat protein
MTMPEDRTSETLAEVVRLERAGLLDRALDRLADAEGRKDPAMAAELLRHRADVQRARCAWDAALADARRSRAVAESAGLTELAAEAMNAEAGVHMSRRAYREAEALLRRMLGMTPAPRIRGIGLQNLGVIAAEAGRLAEARERFSESQQCFEAAGYQRGLAMAMVNEGRIALLEGRSDEAESLCAEAGFIAERDGDLEVAAMAAFNRAEALIRGDRVREAELPASEALGYFTGAGNPWRRMDCLRLFGDLYQRIGEVSTARACYESALQVARSVDTPRDEARLREIIDRLGAAAGGGGGGAPDPRLQGPAPP